MNLKKFAPAGLAALLILVCAACAVQPGDRWKPSSGHGEDRTTKSSARKPSGNGEDTYSVEGSVLFDRDGITVTPQVGLQTPRTRMRPLEIGLEIQNTGEKDLCLGVTSGIVNGFMNQLNLSNYCSYSKRHSISLSLVTKRA